MVDKGYYDKEMCKSLGYECNRKKYKEMCVCVCVYVCMYVCIHFSSTSQQKYFLDFISWGSFRFAAKPRGKHRALVSVLRPPWASPVTDPLGRHVCHDG